MALNIETSSGVAGSCPRLIEGQPPSVILSVGVRGREVVIVELTPPDALRLGASLMRDAQQSLQLQPHQHLEEIEREDR